MNLVDVEVERSRYGSRDVILVKEYRKKEKATASADDDALISRLLATKPDAGANLEKREHSAPRGELDENTRRRQQATNESVQVVAQSARKEPNLNKALTSAPAPSVVGLQHRRRAFPGPGSCEEHSVPAGGSL